VWALRSVREALPGVREATCAFSPGGLTRPPHQEDARCGVCGLEVYTSLPLLLCLCWRCLPMRAVPTGRAECSKREREREGEGGREGGREGPGRASRSGPLPLLLRRSCEEEGDRGALSRA
jgi:hypothetical protein